MSLTTQALRVLSATTHTVIVARSHSHRRFLFLTGLTLGPSPLEIGACTTVDAELTGDPSISSISVGFDPCVNWHPSDANGG